MSKQSGKRQKIICTSKRVSVLIVVSAVLLAFGLGILIMGLDSKNQDIESVQKQTAKLLYGTDRVPGFTCGVLNQSIAEKLLGVSLVREYGQGPNTLKSDHESSTLYWADSCRYVDPDFGLRWVELFVSTYQSNEDALADYSEYFPAVNDIVKLDAKDVGEELYYDSGAYYLLQGNNVVVVTASNGNASEIEEFSKSVFDSLIEYL